ncbi:MAG: NOL1/NOP2/sun family putative RNA methylase [archaeon]
MLDSRILNALTILARKLKKYKWVLIGSTNLAVQGVDVAAHDLDIMIDRTNMEFVAQDLKEYEKKEFEFMEKGPFKGYYSEYEIDGVKVEIMVDFEILQNNNWEKLNTRLEEPIMVNLRGLLVPCSRIEEQLRGYKHLNRDKDQEKIAKLENFLANRSEKKHKYEMKPLFEQRMQTLLSDPADFEKFKKIIHMPTRNFIRCNNLKITPDALMERLNKKWKVVQPFSDYPEIMIIESNLDPGELGSSLEHLLGYYYVQEISSMLSILALDPKPGELVLDICASPGSKTSQMAARMENQGTIIANDFKMDRIAILSANLERCGAMNTIITRNDGVQLCERLATSFKKFDKILLDAPCSGEGTLRSSVKTFLMWNPKVVKKFGRQQKKMMASALKCLKVGGTLVYSTCTHAPEEDESVVNFALRNFPVKLETIALPLKCRPGISKWGDETFLPEIGKCCRIYPQDNDSEGFFVSKLTLLEEIK